MAAERITRGQFLRRAGGFLAMSAAIVGGVWWVTENQKEKKVREPSPQEVSIFGSVIREHLQRASNPELFKDLEEYKPRFNINYGRSASDNENVASLYYKFKGVSWLIDIIEPGTIPLAHNRTQLDLSFSVPGFVNLDVLANKAEQLFIIPPELNDIPWSSDGPIVGHVSKTKEFKAQDAGSYSYYLNVTAYNDPTMNFSRARLIVRFPESDTGFHYFTPRQLTIR